MRIKICGMKYRENMKAVAQLEPDYLGFIFHRKSPRFLESPIPTLPQHIKKVGVFVDADLQEIVNHSKTYSLSVVQLHGKESANFCENLQARGLEVLKAFSVGNSFDFEQLKSYEKTVDAFLFDTKGKAPGGNGVTFNWEVLKSYPSDVPFFLSGGIGKYELEAILELRQHFIKKKKPQLFAGIDLNSKFEFAPGLKRPRELESFLLQLRRHIQKPHHLNTTS